MRYLSCGQVVQTARTSRQRSVKALSIIQRARSYQCGVCQQHTPGKLAKPASLPQANHFNELLEADFFHVKWNADGAKSRVLAILRAFSKYEINAHLERETEELELKVPRFLKNNGSKLLVLQNASALTPLAPTCPRSTWTSLTSATSS